MICLFLCWYLCASLSLSLALFCLCPPLPSLLSVFLPSLCFSPFPLCYPFLSPPSAFSLPLILVSLLSLPSTLHGGFVLITLHGLFENCCLLYPQCCLFVIFIWLFFFVVIVSGCPGLSRDLPERMEVCVQVSFLVNPLSNSEKNFVTLFDTKKK